MKSPIRSALLAAAFVLPSLCALRAGEPASDPAPKKSAVVRPVRRDTTEAIWSYRPAVRYVDVRIVRQRNRPPWAPAAPGD